MSNSNTNKKKYQMSDFEWPKDMPLATRKKILDSQSDCDNIAQGMIDNIIQAKSRGEDIY